MSNVGLSRPRPLILVAALANNRAIGLNGRMPWHLPDELQYFKKATMGKPVIMGRKTWQAIGRPLPGRQNLVVSRNEDYQAQGCQVVNSLEAALLVADSEESAVIGGGELYRMALPLASRMLLTIVNCEPKADTWFPEWQASEWQLKKSLHHEADEAHEYSFDMQEWAALLP